MSKKWISLFFMGVLALKAQEKDVSVYHETRHEGAVVIFVKNHSSVPQSVRLEATTENMSASKPLPILNVLEAGETREYVTLTPEPGKSYGYNYKYTYIRGDVTARHDPDHVYYLPYPKGESYQVDQGYNELPTHMDQYALDFNMDEGETICAIREGTVMEVVDKHNKGCPEKSCSEFNNYVLVRHEDGSIADYSHIKKKGALVKVGDPVTVGQPLALSGSTGWASGPHLHLEVYVMRFSGQESVKVEYYLDKTTIGIPESQKSYIQVF